MYDYTAQMTLISTDTDTYSYYSNNHLKLQGFCAFLSIFAINSNLNPHMIVHIHIIQICATRFFVAFPSRNMLKYKNM